MRPTTVSLRRRFVSPDELRTHIYGPDIEVEGDEYLTELDAQLERTLERQREAYRRAHEPSWPMQYTGKKIKIRPIDVEYLSAIRDMYRIRIKGAQIAEAWGITSLNARSRLKRFVESGMLEYEPTDQYTLRVDAEPYLRKAMDDAPLPVYYRPKVTTGNSG